MTDNMVVNVILAIVASATGTVAIIGLCVFTFLCCRKRHQARSHLQEQEQNSMKKSPASRREPEMEDTNLNQTSSVMSEDDSIFTNRDKVKNSKRRPIDLDNDSDDDSDNVNTAGGKNMMHPYNNYYNDDTWSYAVTEEGSVLVATFPATNKGLGRPTTPKQPQILADADGRTMFEV